MVITPKIGSIYVKAAHTDTPRNEAKAFALKLREIAKNYRNPTVFLFNMSQYLQNNTSWEFPHRIRFESNVRNLWTELDKEAANAKENNETSGSSTTEPKPTSGPNPTSGPIAGGTATKTNTTTKTAKPMTSKARKKAAEPWRYDPTYDAGPDYIWIREYTYNTKRSRIVVVRGHWRKRRNARPKTDESWTFDPNLKFDTSFDPGAGWTWANGFTRKNDGKNIRGAWRASRTCWKRAA